ncbi:L17 family ribosomal protein, partial [Campylobacter coli]|uniref:L17 family ribosomal protein n=1 Tax=Campylobacter coli TaxID=195 RepID=UPI0032D9A233
DFNAHRAVFAALQDKNATNKLVTEIAPNFKERNGGYTRIIKTNGNNKNTNDKYFYNKIFEVS